MKSVKYFKKKTSVQMKVKIMRIYKTGIKIIFNVFQELVLVIGYKKIQE